MNLSWDFKMHMYVETDKASKYTERKVTIATMLCANRAFGTPESFYYNILLHILCNHSLDKLKFHDLC